MDIIPTKDRILDSALTLFAAPVSLLIRMCDREPEREQEVPRRIKVFFGILRKSMGLNDFVSFGLGL